MSFASIFLICKIVTIFIPTSQNYFEDQIILKSYKCDVVDIFCKCKLLLLNPKMVMAVTAANLSCFGQINVELLKVSKDSL